MDEHEVRDGKPGVNESRRKLIKAAAITGGAAVAAAALPGDWKKPLATVGGLPAHAQTSDAPLVISNFILVTVNPDARRRSAMADPGTPIPCTGTFGFVDPLCQVDDTATLWVDVGPCNGDLEFTQTLLQNGASPQSGNSCAGVIGFNFNACGQINGSGLALGSSIALRLTVGTRPPSNVINSSFAES